MFYTRKVVKGKANNLPDIPEAFSSCVQPQGKYHNQVGIQVKGMQ